MRRPFLSTMLGEVVAIALLAAPVACKSRPEAPRPPPPARVAAVGETGTITIDYPPDGAVFPPEFPAPLVSWRDSDETTRQWDIRVTFANGAAPLRAVSAGEPMRLGESDPRAVSPTNDPPALTAEQAAAHTFRPDAATWAAIKQHSVSHPATVAISRHRSDGTAASRVLAQVSIRTSADPVAAPIFYRDVPLMPSENEKGVIKPLAPQAVPLIAWRLRDLAQPESRVVMQGLHTCANCHSFSADGKTLGMDMDGPQNDKGLYALVDVRPRMEIRNQDLVAWSTFRGKLGSKLRVGFMSQLSPDGQHVITTVNDPGVDQTDYQRRKQPVDLIRNYYVANFKDYRFLQVFFPTRGMLAFYQRSSAHLRYLPGADDRRFVHTNAVWTPDGKELIFARAVAQDANPPGATPALAANDPNERQVRFDLFRIPFNGGKGGKPQPIAGASANGMSNSFPKVTPDGRFIVFVQARNGLLMRPDGQLYIVPAKGGAARRMRCNTPLMNSWHSFSPNGRWMVFSSKSRSPYTQLFLTHIDEEGNDSPAILIENSTAANRAANIPEFVNIPPDQAMVIDTPAAEYARHTDTAVEAMKARRYDDAVAAWRKALDLAADDARTHNGLGVALMETGQPAEAIVHYRKALALNPSYPEAHNNLGEALSGQGAVKEAVGAFERALVLDPDYTVARSNLAMLLVRTQRTDAALVHLKKLARDQPESADARRNLGHALADQRRFEEARVELEEAVRLAGRSDPLAMFLLGRVLTDLGRMNDGVKVEQEALELARQRNNPALVQAITRHLDQLLR